jgi:translation initiation factor 5B
MQGFVFRRSNPAIVGVEILSGRMKAKSPLITKAGKRVGNVQKIQDKGADVPEANVGMQVAVSIEDGVVGRNIDEGDILYADVPERHLKVMTTKFPGELTESDRESIKELIEIKRRENPVWGF